MKSSENNEKTSDLETKEEVQKETDSEAVEEKAENETVEAKAEDEASQSEKKDNKFVAFFKSSYLKCKESCVRFFKFVKSKFTKKNDNKDEETTENAVSEEVTADVQGVAVAEGVSEPASETISEPVSESETVVADEQPRRRHSLTLTQRKALSGWLFVLPFVIGIVAIYMPIIINSLRISFSDLSFSSANVAYTGVGFANYKYAFLEDEWYSMILVGSIKGLILQIPAIVIFSLFMAIILNQEMKGRAVFRAIFFLPVILSNGIIDYLNTQSEFMKSLENGAGAIDDNTGAESGAIISALDIQRLLGDIQIGKSLVSFVTGLVNDIFNIISRSGVQMLIFLSGLQSISPAIYESCQIEGASAWETFWKITLPMISPMILVNAIYTVIDSFTSAQNELVSYINKIFGAISTKEEATAMTWIYVLIILGVILVVALIMKAFVFYQKRD